MALVTIPETPINIPSTLPVPMIEPIGSNFTTIVPEASTLNSLLKYVEGYPWTVNYYGQILNTSNIPSTFDPTNINLLSPYYLINKLILQVSAPLISNYNSNTGITTVEGTSIMPYNIKPIIGDLFLVNIDNGEDAIFVINSVNRKTYRKDTIYEVTYYLLYYVSTNQSFYDTLNSKVQDLYYFNKDTNFFNRDNLLTTLTKEAVDRLNDFLWQSKSFYFQSFTKQGLGGLLLPNKSYKLYDPLLVDFIMQTVELSHEYNKLSLFNYSDEPAIKQPTILTALIKRDKQLLTILNKQQIFTPARNLSNKARLGTLVAAGINYVLYPINATEKYKINNATTTFDPLAGAITYLTPENYTGYNINIMTTTGTKPLFPILGINNTYIVSNAFYSYAIDPSLPESLNISYIELIIYRFLNNEAISKKDLVIAIQNYEQWDSITQLYYLPILWLIIKNT